MPEELTEAQIQQLHGALLALQTDLKASLADGSRGATVELDQTTVGRLSRMDAMQQQAMHIANDARRQQRHMALLAALKRMDAGDYGYCHHCDEEIGAGRLAIDPAVTLCVHCTQ